MIKTKLGIHKISSYVGEEIDSTENDQEKLYMAKKKKMKRENGFSRENWPRDWIEKKVLLMKTTISDFV